MAWLTLTSVDKGTRFLVNADNLAFIADPPEDEAENGVGAGISFVGDNGNIIAVKESRKAIENELRRQRA